MQGAIAQQAKNVQSPTAEERKSTSIQQDGVQVDMITPVKETPANTESKTRECDPDENQNGVPEAGVNNVAAQSSLGANTFLKGSVFLILHFPAWT